MQRRPFGLVVVVLILVASVALTQELAHGLRHSPDLDEIYNISPGELLKVDIQAGGPGWFGTQLGQLKVRPYVHGYVVFDSRDYDLNRRKQINTVNMHYVNILVGANIEDKIAAEVLLEYEHGRDEIDVRYGLLDTGYMTGLRSAWASSLCQWAGSTSTLAQNMPISFLIGLTASGG